VGSWSVYPIAGGGKISYFYRRSFESGKLLGRDKLAKRSPPGVRKQMGYGGTSKGKEKCGGPAASTTSKSGKAGGSNLEKALSGSDKTKMNRKF